jgi:SAM-dependent methyltransferase
MDLKKFASYAEYAEAQSAINRSKLDSVWMAEQDVDALAAVIRKYVPRAQSGICHGVRNGWEVRALRAKLGIDVIGTEISDTATQFEHVIQWDFHELHPDWKGRFDFVYSNSLDHCYDPEKCLDNWMRSLRPHGLCIIHWCHGHTWSHTAADCFSATKTEYLELIQRRFRFLEEIAVPRIDQSTQKSVRTYLIVATPLHCSTQRGEA